MARVTAAQGTDADSAADYAADYADDSAADINAADAATAAGAPGTSCVALNAVRRRPVPLVWLCMRCGAAGAGTSRGFACCA